MNSIISLVYLIISENFENKRELLLSNYNIKDTHTIKMRSFAVLALIACVAHAQVSEEIRPRRVSKEQPCRIKPEILAAPRVSKPLESVEVPDTWEWNNVNGRSLVTTIRQ